MCDISGFDAPMGYPEMIGEVESLIEEFPALAVRKLTASVRGRMIPMLILGNENAGRSVLYVGAHHGMEWITAKVLLRFVRETCEAGGFSADRAICVVPMLNADGCELAVHGLFADDPMRDELIRMNGGTDFSRWQANARGVDLNHNYDAGFNEYKVIEAERHITPGRTLWSGTSPESEPEVAALASFLRFQPSVRGVLTLHTQGEEIYYTSGGASVPGSREIAEAIAGMTGYRCSVPDGTAAYGGLTDWCIRTLGVPSFTIECGRGENPLPASDFPEIYAKLREMLRRFPDLV